MIEFRNTEKMVDWFAGLHANDEPLSIQWDDFFICLLAGLQQGRRVQLSGPAKSATKIFNKEFPGPYSSVWRLLAGALISVELTRLGTDSNDRPQVRAQISEFIDGDRLSSAGSERMNEYALGGFELLSERLQDRQADYASFVSLFQPIILP
jgi:hypothetical protein